jgi:hypothetical protein
MGLFRLGWDGMGWDGIGWVKERGRRMPERIEKRERTRKLSNFSYSFYPRIRLSHAPHLAAMQRNASQRIIAVQSVRIKITKWMGWMKKNVFHVFNSSILLELSYINNEFYLYVPSGKQGTSMRKWFCSLHHGNNGRVVCKRLSVGNIEKTFTQIKVQMVRMLQSESLLITTTA